ncbi:SIMPL domain-containing protein [Pseudoalteromonas sp. JBTF-M23]|uniref:SIMPL domain-containing protein n=2 Tax=Pseudoalteromonas caenipelagi TaxID=2726988 RepID=A0A849VIH6_9GAMM|nr:SIMPL domain-containing protein [Pseudoalteromonas caenipelagi]
MSHAFQNIKEMERTVQVKGLAEQEVMADTVIWPVFYKDADNDLEALVARIEKKNSAIRAFLTLHGFDEGEITQATPSIVDKYAQEYSQNERGFRYIAKSGMTVFSHQPIKVKQALNALNSLAKQGIAITQDDYQNRIEYMFTGLNDIKPQMVQEATQKAREVALKFAKDSDSQLGKIKSARQGQFSISDRDSNTPQIKTVRVVTSVEYYLSD